MDQSPDDTAVHYLAKRIYTASKISTLLNAYAAAGLFLSLGGFGYIAYSRLNIQLDPQERIALVCGIGGAFFSILTFFLSLYRRNSLERERERYEQYNAMARFIEAWSVFEGASKKVAFGDEAEKHRSVRETLSVLRSEGKLTSSELFELEELLRIRNSLVHGSQGIAVNTIKDALERLIAVMTKII
jgi:uncharacterized protein YutE (UPF0331/DUF86 family)